MPKVPRDASYWIFPSCAARSNRRRVSGKDPRSHIQAFLCFVCQLYQLSVDPLTLWQVLQWLQLHCWQLIHQPLNWRRLKGQCEMLGRREGREHLTVQEFLKVKKFNQELKTRQKSSTVGANPETYLARKRFWRRCWKGGSPQKSNIIMNSSSILLTRSLKMSLKIQTIWRGKIFLM